MLSKLREPVSGLTHLSGAISAVAGQIVLLNLSSGLLFEKLSLLVYSVSLFLMFSASSIYHMVNSSEKVTQVLRKLDHAAIYLLIAGTYTPFCINAFHGFWKWGLLAIVWLLALIGIGVKIWVIQAPRWITAGVYVLMGWISVFALREMLATLSQATILWMFIGGVIYTLGAVIYITKRVYFMPKGVGFHEVWHIFVMLGAAAHFAAVLNMVQGLS